MFIESSSPRVPGDLARLYSPAINGASPICVQFWYHMYGPHINALNVYLAQGSTLGTAVWTRSGDQGNKWVQGTIQVPGGSASAQVTNVSILYPRKIFIVILIFLTAMIVLFVELVSLVVKNNLCNDLTHLQCFCITGLTSEKN